MDVMLYTDGASRGNPGFAAAASRVLDGNRLLDSSARFLGRATNNEAEYHALIDGLKRCKELGATRVRWFSDSRVVVDQFAGRSKVKATNLRPLRDEAVRIARLFEEVLPKHVLRTHPAIVETDAAANAVLDRELGSGATAV